MPRGMEAYKLMMAIYEDIKSNAFDTPRDDPNPTYHLVASRCPDGSVYLEDLNGHGTVKMLKRANSTYEIIGPKALFEIWGGRALGDRFLTRLEDGDFFHDYAPQRKRAEV